MSTSRRRKAVRTLRRRRDFLLARVAVVESRGEERELDYDKAEIHALNLALAVFEDAEAIGLPNLGELTAAERIEFRDRLARSWFAA